MRSTLDIIIAVKESQPVTQEELRLALVVMSNVEHFISHTLMELVEAVEEGKPSVKLRAGFAKDTMERMFQALKKDPNDWLGPANTPGTPEYSERYTASKRLYNHIAKEKGWDEI